MTVEITSLVKEAASPLELKGNVWKFSEYNVYLSPSAKPDRKEHKWESLTPTLKKLINGLEVSQINRGWQFESVLLPVETSNTGWLNFSLIFSNPKTDTISKHRPQVSRSSEIFVLQSLETRNPVEGYLSGQEINLFLDGTNLLTGNAQYRFNAVLLEETPPLFKRKGQKEVYYQMGVAYIDMNLMPIARCIETEESDIRSMIADFQQELALKRAVLDRLRSSQVTNPVKLF